jgi:hypothetical protein
VLPTELVVTDSTARAVAAVGLRDNVPGRDGRRVLAYYYSGVDGDRQAGAGDFRLRESPSRC